MSVNRFHPHILVLPEDDANRQLANGFLLEPSVSAQQIQILAEAGGWMETVRRFELDHVAGMDRFPHRLMLLLMDFDNQDNRLGDVLQRIPERVKDRVFVLGSLSEPERLRSAGLGSYEQIGQALARDCHNGTGSTWGHALLRCNAGELERMRPHIRPILFPAE